MLPVEQIRRKQQGGLSGLRGADANAGLQRRMNAFKQHHPAVLKDAFIAKFGQFIFGFRMSLRIRIEFVTPFFLREIP